MQRWDQFGAGLDPQLFKFWPKDQHRIARIKGAFRSPSGALPFDSSHRALDSMPRVLRTINTLTSMSIHNEAQAVRDINHWHRSIACVYDTSQRYAALPLARPGLLSEARWPR